MFRKQSRLTINAVSRLPTTNPILGENCPDKEFGKQQGSSMQRVNFSLISPRKHGPGLTVYNILDRIVQGVGIRPHKDLIRTMPLKIQPKKINILYKYFISFFM